MDLKKIVAARRSVRSFEPREVPGQVLEEMVDAARVGPSAANRQPLEYVVVTDPALCAEMFATLKWAAYIAPAGDPPQGHHPTAYIVVVKRADYMIEAMVNYDVGAAVQTMLLVAVAGGLGGCWLKSVNFPKAAKIINLPQGREVDSVIALGYPSEEPTQVDLKPGEEGLEAIKYWREADGRHFVPKRALSAVMIRDRYPD